MALDGIFLQTVKKELLLLVGGRVDKVYQPARDELILSIRTREGSYKLLMNSSAGDARVHITEAQIENPKTPPMFCMLMRKRLVSGRLAEIRQDGLERILYFVFECVNELGDPCRLTLACEIMGRCSNIVLIGGDGKIIDCIKRVTPDVSSVRPVLPGMVYKAPPRPERLSIFSFDRGRLEQILAENKGKLLSKGIVAAFEGTSPLFAREVESFCGRGEERRCGELTENDMDRLCFYLKKTAGEISAGKNNFTVIKTREGVLKDFCFTDISQYGSLMISCPQRSACETLDMFYVSRDADSRRRQKAADLFKLISNLTDRISRRVANQRQELAECAQRDRLRLCGDLIMANLYCLKKGQTSALLDNYYLEDCPKVEIMLDAGLTPAQNAQRYYSEYRKADTAEKKLTSLIADGEKELEYIDSVFDSLTRASDEDEIEALREELSQEGYIRRKQKGKAVGSFKPLHFVSDTGFDIYVGRNNRQNDKLTTKDSEKSDIWLHTHNIAGSHVIISCKGRTADDETIALAARLAAYHSKARESAQVPVDYTFVKNVRKPSGARPGMVIFTNNKTLYVTPDEEEILRLKARK